MTSVSRRAVLSGGAGLALGLGARRAAAGEMGVAVANHSVATACAESDNVDLTFSAAGLRRLTIEARQPAYIGMLAADRTAPDFSACDMSKDPVVAAPVPPRRVTFFEGDGLWLTGLTYPSFWRAADVPVRVGEKVVEGLHLVQLWVRHQERAHEVLVVYPPDGYWRARPLPAPHLGATAYGSSFILGPVETDGRPLVKLKGIRFDPGARRFTLNFAAGGSAALALAELTPERNRLEATFAEPVTGPFAALRSMYVTENNADVARLAWRTGGAAGWQEAKVMDFAGASDVRALWAGRLVASAHNTSAPDMAFDRFEGA